MEPLYIATASKVEAVGANLQICFNRNVFLLAAATCSGSTRLLILKTNNMNIKKFLLSIIGTIVCASVSAQQPASPKLTVYDFGDQSCVNKVSDNGKWAVSFGPAVSNASTYTNARLINIETGEVTALGLENDETEPLVCAAYDVTDDGMVVGSYKGRPATWSKESGWKTLSTPSGWGGGSIECVTPDGKYGVGTGTASDGYKAKGLLYDLTTGKVLETPGIPTKGTAGENFQEMYFTNITADGRYIEAIGDFSYTWNTLGFIYDRETQTCVRPGFNADGTPIQEGVVSLEGTFSPNGKIYAGSAYIENSTEDYRCPFTYNMETGDFKLYDNTTGNRFGFITIDDEGIMYGSPASESSPIRTLYVFVDGFWYPLDEILKLRYGFDYYGQSGFDNTGTCMGVSGDGKTLVAFPDPYKSYVLKMNETFANAARNINVLKEYIATPGDGAAVSSLKAVTVDFKYGIKLVGTHSDIKLTDKDGNSTGKIVGAAISSTGKTLTIKFRSTSLTAGEQYTLTIPAGFVSLASNETRTNEEIVLHYTGREKVPVKAISASPEDGSSLSQLDATTNPVLITYDTNVKLAEDAKAYLYRDSETTPVATLNLVTSQTSVNLDKVMVYPTTTQYLFLGSNYKIVIPAGTITDSNGDNPCEEYTLNYEGLYERVIVSDNENLYTENFSNGMNGVMMRDGDLNTPNAEMQGYTFLEAGDSYAWIPVRDEGSSDFAAASTSAYTPTGKSDDWMVTPQIYIPDEKCRLDFDTQGFRSAKSDKLKVIIYADETKYQYLTAELCEKMRTNGEIVMDEVVLPGKSEDNLAGDWIAKSFKLDKYSGKSIYVAFVNENENQSLVFVDNIKIIHDTGFLTALTSASTVVDKESMPISGRVIITSAQNVSDVSVKLLDADKNVVDEVSASDLSLNKDDKYDFTFSKELPLTVGKENAFYFSVHLGEYNDEVAYTVKDLAFQPTKRVVIEESTGMGCVFCPQGHVAWDYISELYGDKVIIAAYHTYTGDIYASGMQNYVQNFLGLSGAPTAKINRSENISAPMYNETREGKYYYGFTAPDGSCWLDMIEKEFETDADADISITATYDTETEIVSIPYTAKFAMDMEKQNVGLFLIVTEDGLTGYQDNNFATADPANHIGLEDWCAGGKYGSSRVYPFIQNNVSRAHIGNSNYGTVGYIPNNITGGEEYIGEIEFNVPSTVSNITNCKVICMMIDANTGRVINNAQAKITDPTGIEGINADIANDTGTTRFNAAGQMITTPQKGLNIIKMSDGTTRKVMVK